MNISFDIVSVAANITLGMLILALVLALIRLIRGPSLPDRVVALDLMGTLTVGVIAVYDILSNRTVFIDVAIVMALTIFIGTLAFARYIEKGITE